MRGRDVASFIVMCFVVWLVCYFEFCAAAVACVGFYAEEPDFDFFVWLG